MLKTLMPGPQLTTDRIREIGREEMSRSRAYIYRDDELMFVSYGGGDGGPQVSDGASSTDITRGIREDIDDSEGDAGWQEVHRIEFPRSAMYGLIVVIAVLSFFTAIGLFQGWFEGVF